jgi:hypothetical protein
MLSSMAVAVLDLQVAERRGRRAQLVAVPPPSRGPSLSELLARWEACWEVALAALDGAARVGALTSAEVAARRQRIHVEQELVTGELRKLARDRPGLMQP